MVFYTEQELSTAGLKYLPTEIWFHIYKMEHQSNIADVHQELKHVNSQLEIANLHIMIDTMDWPDVIENWTANEYIAFANTTRDENGEEDLVYYIELIDTF